ncbi:MAG: TRAP transporter small permease subunit [Aestuariivita sp.]|uniref:TRAP transporter small permease n=1 Tax=Aestuariivita sp. TaxID=1872407 RepID=UPI003BAEF214
MTGSAVALRLDRITQSVALVGFCGLVVMALLIFYDGTARYLNAPRISGFSDYGEVIFPLVIASCFPAGLLRQTNVTVRVMGKLGGARVNAFFEFLAALVTLVFFAILVWQFFELTAKYASAGRTTRTIDVPLAPWWWGTTAIMALCLPVQVYVTLAWGKALITGTPPAHDNLRHEGEVA